jgi:hypothetical protein
MGPTLAKNRPKTAKSKTEMMVFRRGLTATRSVLQRHVSIQGTEPCVVTHGTLGDSLGVIVGFGSGLKLPSVLNIVFQLVVVGADAPSRQEPATRTSTVRPPASMAQAGIFYCNSQVKSQCRFVYRAQMATR